MRQTIKRKRNVVRMFGIACLCLGLWTGRDEYRVISFAETGSLSPYESDAESFSDSSGASYYESQWALKNNGTVRRISYPRFRGMQRRGPGEGTAAGDTEIGEVTESIAGIDIGIEPAWDVYEQSTERRMVTVALIICHIVSSLNERLQDRLWERKQPCR